MNFVRFWFMRHGQKTADEGDITPFGEKQVEATAVAHLYEHRHSLVAAFSSDMRRASRSVEVALATLGADCPVARRPVQVDELVSFSWLPAETDPRFAFPLMEEELQGAHGANLRVSHWLERWPAANQLRRRLQEFMLRETQLRRTGGDILIGSHSPLAELAAPEPAEAPAGLNFADIVRYTVRSGGEVTIDYLSCPLRVS